MVVMRQGIGVEGQGVVVMVMEQGIGVEGQGVVVMG